MRVELKVWREPLVLYKTDGLVDIKYTLKNGKLVLELLAYTSRVAESTLVAHLVVRGLRFGLRCPRPVGSSQPEG